MILCHISTGTSVSVSVRSIPAKKKTTQRQHLHLNYYFFFKMATTAQQLQRKRVYKCCFSILLADSHLSEVEAQIYPIIASTVQEASDLAWQTHSAELWRFFVPGVPYPQPGILQEAKLAQRKESVCSQLRFEVDSEAPIIKCFRGYVAPDITIELCQKK